MTTMDRYNALNKLSPRNATVLFGSTSDIHTPVQELMKAFDLQETVCNRSVSGMKASRAAEMYAACAAALQPARVLVHIGEEDGAEFAADPKDFSRSMMQLIDRIRSNNENVEIAIVSIRGNAEMNRCLRNVAGACRCDFEDLENAVFDAASMRDTISFVYSTGFIRSLNRRISMNTLAKILFLYDSISEGAEESAAEKHTARRFFRFGVPATVR